jgi:hypothetical protein
VGGRVSKVAFLNALWDIPAPSAAMCNGHFEVFRWFSNCLLGRLIPQRSRLNEKGVDA